MPPKSTTTPVKHAAAPLVPVPTASSTKAGAKAPKAPKAPKQPKSEKKTKRKRDPNAPKKPKSGYIFFSMAQRPLIKKSHPDISFGDIGKELAVAWAALSETTKAKFQAAADEDKVRYADEMKAYKPTGVAAAPAAASKKTKTSAAGASKAAPKKHAVVPASDEEDEDEEDEEEDEEEDDE